MRFPRISSFLSYRVSPFLSCLVLLLLLGAGSWIINAALFPPEVTGWLRLQPDVSSWAGFLLGLGMWLGAGAACFGLLALISMASDLLQALAAMWRPIVIVAAAGYLLFFNDQGRELGHSLLGQHDRLPILSLFAALFYWAANTWHSARLGINHHLRNGVLVVASSHPSQVSETRPERRVLRGDERWLYWPPRLLGVCAHLFAAINLSLAAWNIPFAAPPSIFGFDAPQWLQWLARSASFAIALSAPLAIAFATAFVWAEDVTRSSRQKKFASTQKIAIAGVASRASVVGAFLVLGGLAYAAFYSNRLPKGFLPGTLSIFLSALVFLACISWLRNLTPPLRADASPSEREADDIRQQRQIRFFTLSLFAVAFLVAALVWRFPIWFGTLGSMVVAYFAFGAILALANAIELAIAFASGRPIIKRWFGDWAIPRALGACVIALAIVFGVANAWLHPFHRVRLCDGDCKPVMSPDQRPTVRRAARAWYEQAEAAYKQAGGNGPVPMVIVATAGGGIRAAYWTATVLERLAGDFERGGGSMRPYLFAISGVSGGSVGAAAFEAALTQRDEKHCKPDKPGDTAGKRGDKTCPLATDFLEEDFLAPALASLVFRDAPSSFLPDLGQGDRGTALESGFEQASNDLLARPFLSFFRLKNDSPLDQEPGPWWRPILLLNATHEETGNRIIAGHVLIERNVFVDSLDALQMLGQDVRASTAAHNSARFTYVSPAGDLGSNAGSVIDGGYFENFGALSAMELAHAATAALNDPSKPPKVKLIVLMISSDPDLNKNHMLVRINQSENKHPGKCLVSIAEREPVSGDKASAGQTSARLPNYFSVDPSGVENALVNEFLAPFQGLEKVREAHGNWAAAELALEICTERNGGPSETQTAASTGVSGEPSQIEVAAVRDNSADVIVDVETKPVNAKVHLDRPYFAHLAMCKEATASKDPKVNNPAPIQPPLGWMLSTWTQDNFPRLLSECGNNDELDQLEIALGGTPPLNPADQVSAGDSPQ
jgi:hypothetical protein